MRYVINVRPIRLHVAAARTRAHSLSCTARRLFYVSTRPYSQNMVEPHRINQNSTTLLWQTVHRNLTSEYIE